MAASACLLDLHSSEVLQRVVITEWSEVNCFVNYSKADCRANCRGGCGPVGDLWRASSSFFCYKIKHFPCGACDPTVSQSFLYVIPTPLRISLYIYNRFYMTGREYLSAVWSLIYWISLFSMSGIRPDFTAFPFNEVGFGNRKLLFYLEWSVLRKPCMLIYMFDKYKYMQDKNAQCSHVPFLRFVILILLYIV